METIIRGLYSAWGLNTTGAYITTNIIFRSICGTIDHNHIRNIWHDNIGNYLSPYSTVFKGVGFQV